MIDTTSGTFDVTYLSLGAGVQSSALLVLACTDPRVPRPDFAVFADTGDEPYWVYNYLEELTAFAAGYGVPVVTASNGRLSEWVVDRQRAGKRFVNVPAYTATPAGVREGMLRRQCTREFKIEPIERKVRERLGYRPRQRVRERVRAMMGISIDEATRMRPSRTRWVTNAYPLVDLQLTRDACRRVVLQAGLPEPQKSACVFCPYHSDGYWHWMKTEEPEVFAQAVAFDYDIRDMTMQGRQQPAYLHRSLVPLDEVVFDVGDPNQGELFENECEGMCGV